MEDDAMKESHSSTTDSLPEPTGPYCIGTAKYDLEKEQLRELLIKTANELLDKVNKNNEIKEFIK